MILERYCSRVLISPVETTSSTSRLAMFLPVNSSLLFSEHEIGRILMPERSRSLSHKGTVVIHRARHKGMRKIASTSKESTTVILGKLVSGNNKGVGYWKIYMVGFEVFVLIGYSSFCVHIRCIKIYLESSELSGN